MIGPSGAVELAPSIALLLNNPFLNDSRSWKLASTLAAAGYRVTVVARHCDALEQREEREGFTILRVAQPPPLRWLPAPPLPADAAPAVPGPTQVVREVVGRTLQGIRFLLLARHWAEALGHTLPQADIWQAEGLVTLPLALALRRRRGGRVVYDSRDLHVESGRFARLPGPWRRLLRRRERAWVRAADALLTVSRPYADVLEETFGRAATIVMNTPPAWQRPDPPPRRFHERLGLGPDERVVLYLGQVVAHRGIEELCDAIGLVERAVLVVVGFGAGYETFRARAAALPHAARIHFLPGVSPEEIPACTASADVSAMPVQASTLNHRLNTPTKLFDAMGAGTPVVASDLPGMAPIVRETGCGVLCDPNDAADIARGIRAILDAPPEVRARYRDACLEAARGPYGWQPQAERLLTLYATLGVPAPGGSG